MDSRDAELAPPADTDPDSGRDPEPGFDPETDLDPAGQPTVRKRRRGSRGGKNRKRTTVSPHHGPSEADDPGEGPPADAAPDPNWSANPAESPGFADQSADGRGSPVELPERIGEGRPSAEAGDRATVRKPQIGDTRPAPLIVPSVPPPGKAVVPGATPPSGTPRSRGAKGKSKAAPPSATPAPAAAGAPAEPKKKRKRTKATDSGRGHAGQVELDDDVLERRRGRERNGRPVGRYLMCVQVRPGLTQVAVLEGRNLIEHYVSRPADDVSQIHGNIYLGKVQNVLPGMEAAFVDIGTPKNAVLYRGDVQYDAEDIEEKGQPRIEQMLRARQLVMCQVTKNPIGAKGARLTQEVSLPGRFVVLIPNSKTYGISKRLPDDVRKRLRAVLDRVKPAEHGLIVRTAAEHASEHELRADMTRLLDQWAGIAAKAAKATSPTLLYQEPQLGLRVIREEFNADYRGVVIDDRQLYEDVRGYIADFNPELADRVEFYDAPAEGLPLYERFHVHEQLHKALDRKVWLPSGGSLIIEHTEALTVIDVNTGKNVGTTNLEETVFRNNLEAAEEVAKQLRLRDIGGIVVIDFIDMEIKDNRKKVVEAFRAALARDKTRTQVFDISELGLVEMTRKRIGEGLLVNFADGCPTCQGRGVVVDHALLE